MVDLEEVAEEIVLEKKQKSGFPITNIIYALPENVNVHIVVYNLSGKQVQTLVNEFQTPGYHSVFWEADNHPSGVYFVKMHAGNYISIQKLMLVK